MSIVLVQRTAAEVRIIGYIEDSHRTLASYLSDPGKASLARDWPGVMWGTDWLPHDGASRDIKTGKSSEEVLRALGRRVRIIPRGNLEEGIKAARMMFPRCYFDEDRAGALVGRLKRYRRAIPTATGEPGNPVHDENSHGADAFRGLACVVDQMTNSDERLILDMSTTSTHFSEHGWMGV
jgi:phage terminase large subunit